MLSLKELHKKCLYPVVRIRAKKAIGSGTIIYCKQVAGKGGEYETLLLTNQHVVDGLISIKKEWNAKLGRKVEKDFRSTATVETFLYDMSSRVIGSTSYQADIVCYDKVEDLAVLKIRAPIEFPYVATLCHKDDWDNLLAGEEVWTDGAGLGEKPFLSPAGHIGGFGDEIDDKEYLMTSSPTIHGNSGGACWLRESGTLLGIPSRIPVTWGGDAITHMSYIIPIWRICEFLENEVYDFVLPWVDKTPEECAEERKRQREEDELKVLRSGLRREEETVTPKPKEE